MKELDDKLEREFYLKRGIRHHPATGEPFETDCQETKEEGRENERPLKKLRKEESGESEKKESEATSSSSSATDKMESSGRMLVLC